MWWHLGNKIESFEFVVDVVVDHFDELIANQDLHFVSNDSVEKTVW